MCTIDRMLIKGIRSFSPNNTNVIVFYKPLTLIVGSNGAGKTTIIECLKQACTGELPPNTRSGHSFVHDPKVAHETEVKALIKLRFQTGSGQRVTVLRAFQLTQKKSQLQFKTLDSTVVTKDPITGKETATSGKCNDVDKVVPTLMGVSKAVLENVIFVHQEESNWPLAEGRVLKERFDDIFAATKYTKALETLRKLRTEKTHEVKLLNGELNTLRVQRDNAMKLHKDASEAQEAIDAHNEQAAVLKEQIKEKAGIIDQLSASITRLRQFTQEIQVAAVRVQELQKQVQSKRAQLQGFDVKESSEEVAEMLQNFNADLDQKRLQVTRLKREIHSKRLEAASLQDQYSKAVGHQSKLAAEKDAHERGLRQRDVAIREAVEQLRLTGIDLSRRDGPGGSLPQEVVESFQERLTQHVTAAEQALHRLKEDNRKRDEHYTAAVDDAATKVTQSQEQLRMKREQKEANVRSMQNLRAQADDILVDEKHAADAQAHVNELQDKLRQKTEEQARQNYDAKLAAQRKDVERVVAQLAELRQEQDRVVAASEAATKLRLKSKELYDKKEALAAALRSRRADLLQLLGTGDLPPTDALKPQCEAAAAQRRRELDAQQADLRDKQAAESQAKAALHAARQSLSAAEQQRNQVLTHLRARLPPSGDLPVVWEAGRAHENDRVLEATFGARKLALEECKNKLAQQEMMSKYFSRMRQMMCDQRECPACYRTFASEDELNNSLMHIDQDSQNHPARIASLRQRVTTAQEQVDLFSGLQQQWRKAVDLEVVTITEAREAIPAREAALDAATTAAQEAAELVALSQVEEANARQLVAEVVYQLDMQAKEVAALQQEVTRMETSASQSGEAATRTLDQLTEAIDTAEHDRKQGEGTLEYLRNKQSKMRDDILKATRDLSEAREQLNQSKARLDKKAELLAQVAELEARNEALVREATRHERELAPLEERRNAAVAERAQIRSTMQTDEARVERELRDAVQQQDSFLTKVRPLREYEERGGADQLSRAAAAVEQVQQRITQLNREIESKEGEERSATQALAEGETTRHQMQDVLQLRGLEKDLDEQEVHIRRLEEQQQQVGTEASIESKHRTAVSERSGLQGKLDMLKGACQMQQQVLARAQRELQSEQYADIVYRYNQMFAKVMYTELANSDLDKYHKALEKALLSFHTTKMADINKIIKELWQKTYRGQDIDYIQVKADADGQRSYNYRVVMYSGGAELEMRGRCSAGQKVLACLIIRLALAETFCLNCGILALDEPTTNLDAENARSLAEALRAIMVSRKEQENFQLIVITHDESFAHSIGTREHAECMWRITKDEEQHTRMDLEVIE